MHVEARIAGHHLQSRLRAIQGLNMALFVHAQHQSPIGRVQIQPDDVAHLLNEQRIGEGLAPTALLDRKTVDYESVTGGLPCNAHGAP